jgi:hypothetical protein
MTIVATQVYLRGLLDGLVWPFTGVEALQAYITPPDPEVTANVPKAYIWPSRGDESRAVSRGGTVPRALTLGGPSGFKGVIHDLEVYLVWFGQDDDPDADNLFPGMADAVMAALRVSADPAVVADPYTGVESTLIDVAEQMTYQITLRALVDQSYNRYDCLISLSINELIAS